jgi:two-component system OmpR family response regulator
MLRTRFHMHTSVALPNSGKWSESPACPSPTSVLVINDDESEHQRVADYLVIHAMRVRTSAMDSDVVERLLATEAPDVVVVELPSCGSNWINLLHWNRPHSGAPAIIAIGHIDSEAERVSALEVGADTYLSKPYGLRELVARIRAIVRRNQMSRNHVLTKVHCGACRFGNWVLDRRSRCIQAIDGTRSVLTKGECALLLAFLDSPGCPLTREQLLDAMRVHEDVFDRTIDLRVLRLRRKLANGGRTHQIIQTVHGVGYSLAVPVEWV